jgi:FlaA1/EpsC-like NDP-sugar epimerase
MTESASWYNVKRFINISTDKAVSPVNVLGATKLLAERLVIRANYRRSDTIFANVRFGNVTWSEGSVFPVFAEQMKKVKPLKVTSMQMERYYMTIEDAVNLVCMAMDDMKGGETFILKMPTFKMGDLVNAMSIVHGAEIPVEVTGVRQGEKLREELMTEEEKASAVEKKHYWVINGQKDIHS